MNFKFFPSSLKFLALMLTPVLLAPAVLALEFPPTGGVGAPTGGSAGGGVRGASACVTPQNGLSLMALRPPQPDNYVGQTASNTPTMFFYVPKTKAQSAEFILVDRQGNDVYTEELQLSKDGGLVSVKMNLPEAMGDSNEYTWLFVLVCNPSDRGADESIQGQIRQITLDPSVIADLEAAQAEEDLLKQAELLAQAKVWYDSLAIAAQLRDLDAGPWESLLKSVGLDKLTQTPILSLESITGNP
ncbi:DUF928 domain-containing protein [Roseofilum sp. BLCC_M154]|uniref:DUF928 domain-containing protein n=1 Tax=Roseofilum acuticapitatum BLCC-M154 TaxID=3022444 RepID=A0ABT7AW51_9CYAN|nr:DUF928 domain-containing protein [Roseofilum acuticapitatum]MDJ1171148.1 DUF928 domain-containing protein [Roseofilum acuticapitatum BLCC-M154]